LDLTADGVAQGMQRRSLSMAAQQRPQALRATCGDSAEEAVIGLLMLITNLVSCMSVTRDAARQG